jgi:macrolide transport system ATP-binding/permease protein
MSTLLRDLRFGWRQLARSPGFTAIAVITLALGIGANTAIFSIINGVFLRGLPAQDPDQLVGLSFHQKGVLGFNFSYPDFQDIRQQANQFSSILGCMTNLDGLSEGNRADQVITSYVTGNYFTTLGLKPALGRLILPSEGKISGSDPVLVLGYSYWKERFGSDPGVLGKQVEVDGVPLTVIGVAPEGLRGLTSIVDVQAYMPANMMVSVHGYARDWATHRGFRLLTVVGRLKPGATMDDAQASLDVIARRLAEQYPKDDRGATIGTYPGKALRSLYQPTRQRYKVELIAAGLFLGLAALVLLLACFNVANLLLVRATAREHEMAVRAALGAGRGRLTRQILTESLLLACLSGIAGILLGNWGNSALSAIHLQLGFPIHLNFGFDGRDLAFAVAAAVLSGIVVGAVPAVRASRADPSDALHEGGRGVISGRHRLRSGLVVAEIAGSVVLLVVAGLFTRSLEEVQHVELGFNPNHVLNLTIDPHDAGYDEARGREFYHDLLRQVRALQGVKSASLAFSYPASYYADDEAVYVEGRLPPPGQAAPRVQDNTISPGYFRTMGIRIVKGRGFAETDNASAPDVAVINQTMAKDFWPGEDPVGQHFKLSSVGEDWIQVVGVARDSRYVDLLANKRPYFYLPLDQGYASLVTLQVRTLEPPPTMIAEVEQQIHSLAPGLPVFGVQTMNEALDSPNGFFHYRLGSGLAAALGLLGLILAVVGVYGVVSYTASQRTHEIGIRMALGAQASDVWKMVFGQGLMLAGEGVLAGLLAALAVSHMMAHILFSIRTYDPLTFGSVAALLVIVALLACYIPARRAARVDPMVALRYE